MKAARLAILAAVGASILSLTGVSLWSTQTALAWDDRGGGEGCTPGYWKQDQHFDSCRPKLTSLLEESILTHHWKMF